ncbi:hypothetical protein AHAS_Ahas13G0204400 [Arachis hypogaea]
MIYDSIRVLCTIEEEKRVQKEKRAAEKRAAAARRRRYVGDVFLFRMELCVLGLHCQIQAGIDYLAASMSPIVPTMSQL